MHKAASILACSSVASQVLALVRDRLLAHTFGAGTDLDVYYAAFRVPDFLFVSIASFVSVTVLIPFFMKWRESGQEAHAKHFLREVLTVFSFVMCLVMGAVFLLAPLLAPMVAPGFTPAALGKLTFLMRLMLLSPFLLGFSGLIGTVTQSFRRFWVYALSPVLYNLGIICGVLFFAPFFGIAGVAGGVVLGAFLHAAIQVPTLVKLGYSPHFTSSIVWKEIRDVVLLSLPRTIGLGLSQVVILGLTALASRMAVGSIAIFTFAYNLQSVPLSLVGVSYSVAVFPSLAESYAAGQREHFRNHVISAARHIIFWSLPLSTLFVVFRVPIVSIILGSGRFAASDVGRTAITLAAFVVSVAAQGLLILFTRSYYAAGETRKPLIANTTSSVCAILLAWFLPRDVLMLALAYSAGMVLNVVFHWIAFFFDFGGMGNVLGTTFLHALLASLASGLAAALLLPVNIALAGGAGFTLAFGILWLLDNEEMKMAWRAARAIV